MSKVNEVNSEKKFVGPMPPTFSCVAVTCVKSVAKAGTILFLAVGAFFLIFEFGPVVAAVIGETYSAFVGFVKTGGYVWLCFSLGILIAGLFYWAICVGKKLRWKFPIRPFVCFCLFCVLAWFICALAVSEIITNQDTTTFVVAILFLMWSPVTMAVLWCFFNVMRAIDHATSPYY